MALHVLWRLITDTAIRPFYSVLVLTYTLFWSQDIICYLLVSNASICSPSMTRQRHLLADIANMVVAVRSFFNHCNIMHQRAICWHCVSSDGDFEALNRFTAADQHYLDFMMYQLQIGSSCPSSGYANRSRHQHWSASSPLLKSCHPSKLGSWITAYSAKMLIVQLILAKLTVFQQTMLFGQLSQGRR